MAKKVIPKQILRFGEWKHPNAPEGKLKITPEWGKKLVENFKKTPFAPILRSHVSNEEAEKNPYLIVSKNIKGLSVKEDGIYADMELDENDLDKYNDVSAGLDMQYVDKETGNVIGPVLRHVALVLNPYIKGLKPFLSDTEQLEYIYLSDINPMNEEKQPVEETQEVETQEVEETPAEETEETVEETVTEEEAVEEETTEETTEEETETETVDASDTGASVNLHDMILQQNAQIASLQKQLLEKKVEDQYNTLLSEGKIIPAQEMAVKALLSKSEEVVELADGESKTVGQLLADLFDSAPSLVNLEERGVLVEDTPSAIDPKVRKNLRSLHSNLSDDQFEAYLIENEVAIKKAQKKYM